MNSAEALDTSHDPITLTFACTSSLEDTRALGKASFTRAFAYRRLLLFAAALYFCWYLALASERPELATSGWIVFGLASFCILRFLGGAWVLVNSRPAKRWAVRAGLPLESHYSVSERGITNSSSAFTYASDWIMYDRYVEIKSGALLVDKDGNATYFRASELGENYAPIIELFARKLPTSYYIDTKLAARAKPPVTTGELQAEPEPVLESEPQL